MRRRTTKQSKFKEGLIIHIKNNMKQYIIAGIVFLVGIILGVVFVNNIAETQMEELESYINTSITQINTNNFNKIDYIKEKCIENISIITVLWFVGLTIVGIIINYLILAYKGFCIGYTISAMICTLGKWKGTAFAFTSMFLQNLLFVLAMVGVIVSGTKIFLSILKDARKENIIVEIVRHTIFSVLMIIFTILSAFVEVYISNELLKLTINFWIDKT